MRTEMVSSTWLKKVLEETTTSQPQPLQKPNTRIMLMLVGPPGSGKSTICNKIIPNAARPWTRICQDVISKGHRGTRVQCLKQAASAVSKGSSILIDRCNIDVDQRRDFLELAKERGIQAHALVLNFPSSVCIQRATQRTEHEGGLLGPDVGRVVNQVYRSRQLPTLGEGFSRITYCRTDAEVEKAVTLYSQLHTEDHLPLGIFGSTVYEGKGTLQFSATAARDDEREVGVRTQQMQQTSAQESQASPGINPGGSSIANKSQDLAVDKEEKSTLRILFDSDSSEGKKTLAFPSISTSDFQFDHEKAADIIVKAAIQFFQDKEHAGLRLIFVDLSPNSDMLARVRRNLVKEGLDPQQLLTHAGDITKLRSSGGLACNMIANAANWRLKPGGGGVNAAIYKAAGHDLEQATKQYASTLNPGSAVVVPLPLSSPLRKVEGVTHVIHVLGPNMNPQRPNCLAGDYIQGCQILRATYASLFNAFSTTVKGQASLPLGFASQERAGDIVAHESNKFKNGGGVRGGASSIRPRLANAFTILMNAAKQKGTGELDTMPKRKRPVEKELNEIHSEITRSAARKWDAWAQALRAIVLHPEQHASIVRQVTDEAVVISDQYPKGQKHLLVIARRDGLDSIEDVCIEHLPVLQHLHSLGETWATSLLKEDPSLVFRLGYHWVPSMQQLHMHVISQDLDSPGLKNKKHWNSFTTDFFRDSQDILSEVENCGRVKPCSPEVEDRLLKMELRCHRCHTAQPNIPRLKSHLRSCKTPLKDLPQQLHLIKFPGIGISN
ncbi:unnamed protein product [Sphagnum balticum]